DRGKGQFFIQNEARYGSGKTNSIRAFSAMLVRNIMPVCVWMPVRASSAIISSAPSHSFIVCSFGWAAVGRVGPASGGSAGVGAFLQPPVQPLQRASAKRKVRMRHRFMAKD